MNTEVHSLALFLHPLCRKVAVSQAAKSRSFEQMCTATLKIANEWRWEETHRQLETILSVQGSLCWRAARWTRLVGFTSDHRHESPSQNFCIDSSGHCPPLSRSRTPILRPRQYPRHQKMQPHHRKLQKAGQVAQQLCLPSLGMIGQANTLQTWPHAHSQHRWNQCQSHH